MKTLSLTIAATAFATIFSSCCCSENPRSQSSKRYDSKGRLVKEVLHDGNFNTYSYQSKDGTHAAPSRNMDWFPRIP